MRWVARLFGAVVVSGLVGLALPTAAQAAEEAGAGAGDQQAGDAEDKLAGIKQFGVPHPVVGEVRRDESRLHYIDYDEAKIQKLASGFKRITSLAWDSDRQRRCGAGHGL
jgi:hypothetical protein